MKNTILVLFTVLLLVGCKKSANRFDIILSKSDAADSAYINIDFLSVSNKGSIIYKAETHQRFDFLDTVSLNNLPDGDYELVYNDMIGDRIERKISLKNNESKAVKIVFDSISLDRFYTKIPFNHLKDNESYTIEGKGGCMATMYCHYTIEKHKQVYYFESVNIPKRLLKPEEIKAVKRFESELLAIQGKDICSSTGRMTYTILQDEKKTRIVDNTCNWNGFENLMRKVDKDEK
jgi:hypothetical protein